MKNKFTLISIVWLVVVTILLTLPGSAFPSEDWLSKIWFDKWVHIGLYSIMSFLFCYTLYKKKGLVLKSFMACAMIALSHGIIMEFIQKYFVVNRSFDRGDIIADAIGSLFGVIAAWKWLKK